MLIHAPAGEKQIYSVIFLKLNTCFHILKAAPTDMRYFATRSFLGV